MRLADKCTSFNIKKSWDTRKVAKLLDANTTVSVRLPKLIHAGNCEGRVDNVASLLLRTEKYKWYPGVNLTLGKETQGLNANIKLSLKYPTAGLFNSGFVWDFCMVLERTVPFMVLQRP